MQPLLHGRVRDHDGVVLILPLPVWPLGASTPTTRNGMFLMRMTASERVVVAEQLIAHDGLADHRDFGGAVHVAVVKKTALGDLPVANLLELRRDAL